MIREAVIEDLEALAGLYKELKTYHHNLDPEGFKIPSDDVAKKRIGYYLEHSDNDRRPKYICHETDGVVDAYAFYEVFSPYIDGEKIADIDGSVSIQEIVVSENSRRQGIGTELIHRLYEIAKENHCGSMYVGAHADNYGAQQFYKKFGLVPKSINMEMKIDISTEDKGDN